MRLQPNVHSPIPIRRHLAEPLTDVTEGRSVLQRQVLPRTQGLAGSLGVNPNGVTRAIEDLKCSGYRPLHLRPRAPAPWSTPGTPPATGRDDAEDGDEDGEAGEA